MTAECHSFVFGDESLYFYPQQMQVSHVPLDACGPQREVNRERTEPTFLTVHLTEKCNLACDYCFAAHLPGTDMSRETGEAAVDFLLSQDAPDVTVRFFGGEPLVAFEQMRHLTEYAGARAKARGQTVHFNIFTNAVGLTAKHVAFFEEHQFSAFVSMDGPKPVHDRHRLRKNGSGTFDRVFENVQQLAKALPFRVVLRAIIDPGSDDNLVGIVETLFSTGAMYASLGLPWVERESRFALDKAGLERLLAEVDALGHWYLDNIRQDCYERIGFDVFSKVMRKMMNPAAPREAFACGAGVEGLAVATDGTLYPCQAFVGHARYAMGTVGRPSVGGSAFDRYGAETVDACSTCWARYMCSARCPYDSYIHSGDIYAINGLRCAFFRRAYEVGIAMHHALTTRFPRQDRIVRRLLMRNTARVGAY